VEVLAVFLTSLFRRPQSDSLQNRRPAKARRASRPRQRSLWLEALEDRALPSTLTVTSATDDGSAGTLRAVLAASHDGDTIRFAPQLDGSTIALTQGQLVVDHDLSIVGLGATPDRA
jgi:hypothetical protein